MCAGANCCACTRITGDIYYWQAPQLRPQCGTACSDMISRWQGYLADPAMVACTGAADCTVVGGQPAMDPCNGHSAIGYCGVAANASAYRASPAASLEAEFAANCPNHTGFDCGPGHATCSNGKCTVQGWGCCLCQPDAGRDLASDVPVPSSDGRLQPSEAGGGEAGGG